MKYAKNLKRLMKMPVAVNKTEVINKLIPMQNTGNENIIRLMGFGSLGALLLANDNLADYQQAQMIRNQEKIDQILRDKKAQN